MIGSLHISRKLRIISSHVVSTQEVAYTNSYIHCILLEKQHNQFCLKVTHKDDGGLVVSMLASGTQDLEFEPGRTLRIFLAKKKSTACLPSEGK
jgi:hypothetical protein